MLDMLVFYVDLKRVPVLIVLAAVRTSYCLFCTRVYVLHVANKVLCRDIFITSLTVDLTCNLIKDHSWSRPINIVYHSQVLLTGGVVFENLLAHWTFDLIVRSMHISCVPWVVLCINVLIAVSTENCPCKKLNVTMHSSKKSHQGEGQPLLRFQAITGWQFGTNYAGHACASYRRRRSWTLSDKLDIEPLCCCEHLSCAFGNLPQSCHTSHTSCSFLKWQIELNKVTEMQVWRSP